MFGETAVIVPGVKANDVVAELNMLDYDLPLRSFPGYLRSHKAARLLNKGHLQARLWCNYLSCAFFDYIIARRSIIIYTH
jgi:hypothetical protein